MPIRPTRSAALIAGVAMFLFATLALFAQIPARNVNVVSVDPFLQKQNEPSLALSTTNPCRMLMGGNDYRTVNIPGISGDGEIHDAWVGVYESMDCGQTWIAGLMPGFPQDQSALGMASPASGFSTAGDPTVRAGLGGFIPYSFIVYNRGTNVGKLLLARFLDTNNTEVTASTITSTDPLQIPPDKWPIKYVSPTLVVDGNTAQFLDKPSMAVSKGTGTCTLDGRTIPASVVHLVWTTFINNAPDGKIVTRVNYNSSSNCGVSTDRPTTKLSESFLVGQGASIAVNPVNGAVFVAWRQFNHLDLNQSEIMFVKSVDGGQSFSLPQPIPTLSGMTFFHQETKANPTPQFRTTAFPSIVFDHNGRLFVTIAARMMNTPKLSSRITLTTTMDGVSWTPPVHLAPNQTDAHQIMPTITYSSGKLRAIWYDFIDDASQHFEVFVDDGHLVTGPPPLTRHTVDVRGAEGNVNPDGSVTWNVYGVLQLPTVSPKLSQYLLGFVFGSPLRQLQWNRPALQLYCGGHCPFLGDYIDVGGLDWVPQITPESQAGTAPPNWVHNGPATAEGFSKDFHTAWTDNRDAIVDSVIADKAGQVLYTAPGVAGCDPSLTLTRNANIYASRVTPGLSILLPVNAKPTNSFQRTFPFSLVNGTSQQRTFRVSIENQPPFGSASFAQFGSLTTILVTIPARSSVARTVFATSTIKYPPIRIVAAENVATPTITASAVINPDPTNLDIQGSVATSETHGAQFGGGDIRNPEIENPEIENPEIENPEIENPEIENPEIENAQIQNPEIENPEIENATLVSGAVSDTSYEFTNVGNDITAYQIDVDVTGKKTDPYLFQLIARRVYKLPYAKGCTAAKTGQNQVLFNIASPDVAETGFLDHNDSQARNATVLVFPGETIKLTLRVWDKDVATGGLSGPDDPKLDRFCPFADADAGCTSKTKTHTVTIRARPQAADTGTNAPVVVSFTKQ